MKRWCCSAWMVTLALGALPGCTEGTGPDRDIEPFGDADVTVLFIGNSLTATHDLPSMVASIAAADGRSFEYRAILRPNTSLADHFLSGAHEVIRDLRPDVVVLQQGPSSVGANPEHLRSWAEAFATVIRESGGTPALLMVWPERTRMEAFDAVRDAYAGAAEAVDGLFMPAGEAWRAVWALDADRALYGSDGFHPSREGSFVAALTVYATLFDAEAADLAPGLLDIDDTAPLYTGVDAAVHAAAGRS